MSTRIGTCLMAVLLSARALATGPASSPQMDAAVLYQRVAPSVVTIEAQGDTAGSLGSGVVVSDGLVITNNHVVRDAKGFVLIRQGKRTWRADIESTDPTHDLALLAVLLRPKETFRLPPVRRRKTATLKIGERVYAIGSPHGLERTLSDGLISGLLTEDKETIVQTTAPISPGSSGGGLFDGSGQLVAITTLYLRDAQNINFAIPADRIGDLEKASKDWAGVYTLPEATGASQGGPASKPPDLPTALADIRALWITASADGPVSHQGGLSQSWILRHVSQRLQNAGIAVYTTHEDATRAQVYAVNLAIELTSLHPDQTVLFPWSMRVELLDTSDFSSGAHGVVATWNSGYTGFGGSDVVTQQVTRALDEMVDKLAIDLLHAQASRNVAPAPTPTAEPVPTLAAQPAEPAPLQDHLTAHCGPERKITKVSSQGRFVRLDDESLWQIDTDSAVVSSVWSTDAAVDACDRVLINLERRERVTGKVVHSR